MSGQLLFYAIVLLLVLLYARKLMQMRAIRQYSPGELRERMHDHNVVLLDVRTEPERRAQVIRGSLHLPLQQLDRRMQVGEQEFDCGTAPPKTGLRRWKFEGRAH